MPPTKPLAADSAIVRAFRLRLLAWFDLHGRHDLPWQVDRTFYRVWVSEIMLQQTQVATVIGYFERFMRHFPTLERLTQASLDEVLAQWSGLGYYARARHLHKAASEIVTQFKGQFPTTRAAWQALPGVGPSTAGAIVAQVLNQREPILDGNVKRVLARAFALDASDKSFVDACWGYAEKITPSERPRDFTQAIMDLGATLCTRTKPHCEQCPIQKVCRAHQLGNAAGYPKRAPRPSKKIYHKTWLYLRQAQQVYLTKRPATGVWGGLWQCVEFESPNALKRWQQTHPALRGLTLRRLETLKHVFTHMIWQIECYELSLTKPYVGIELSGQWLTRRQLAKIGLPAPVLRILASQ